jgi:HAD superfamily hydrolase (TIGR01450 family)
MDLPPTLTIDQVAARHAVLLLDAYGVLVHHGGPLPGAPELVSRLHRSSKPYFILTNDASRLPSTSAVRFAGMGLPIPEERIITSGGLLTEHFARHGLAGEGCVVLGPEDSRAYVRAAGGIPTTPDDPQASVVVVCDEVGFNFVETVDATLTMLFHRLDAGQPVHLVAPNPDLVYPKTRRGFGITAGSIATMFEAALAQRYRASKLEIAFERLGKPNRPIFAEAERRAGTGDMVMVGDQLGTDILGALQFGIPAALVETGLDRFQPGGVRPTYLLSAL